MIAQQFFEDTTFFCDRTSQICADATETTPTSLGNAHKMVDLYTYDSIVVTPLLEDTVEHLLSSEVTKSVSAGLITELNLWKKSDRGVDIKDNVSITDSDDKEGMKMMPFNLVRRISEQIKKSPKS